LHKIKYDKGGLKIGNYNKKTKGQQTYDPTRNGEKTKRVMKQHSKTLSGMGMREPKKTNIVKRKGGTKKCHTQQ